MGRNRRRKTQVKTSSNKSSSPTTNLAANNVPNETANNQTPDNSTNPIKTKILTAHTNNPDKDSVAMPELMFDTNDSPEPEAELKDPESPCKTPPDPNDAEIPALVTDLLNDIEAHESPDSEHEHEYDCEYEYVAYESPDSEDEHEYKYDYEYEPEQEFNNVGNKSPNLATAPTNVTNLNVSPVEPNPSKIEPLFHSQAQCPSQSQSQSQSQP